MILSLRNPILSLALAIAGLGALAAPDAQARERTRTRSASHVDGARSAAVNASASGANGSRVRGRQ